MRLENEIVYQLEFNGALTVDELCKEIGVSPSRVRNTVERMLTAFGQRRIFVSFWERDTHGVLQPVIAPGSKPDAPNPERKKRPASELSEIEWLRQQLAHATEEIERMQTECDTAYRLLQEARTQ